MNSDKFESLLNKLQSASWLIVNPENSTKKFTTTINEQKVDIYSSLSTPLLYINNVQPELTFDQSEIIMDFMDSLLSTFEISINGEILLQQEELETAIDKIIE